MIFWSYVSDVTHSSTGDTARSVLGGTAAQPQLLLTQLTHISAEVTELQSLNNVGWRTPLRSLIQP